MNSPVASRPGETANYSSAEKAFLKRKNYTMNQGDTVVVMPQHPKKCFEDDKENINPHSGLNQSTSNNIRRGGGNAGGSKYSRGRKPLQEIYIGEEVHVNALNRSTNDSDSAMSKKSAKAKALFQNGKFTSKVGTGNPSTNRRATNNRGTKCRTTNRKGASSKNEDV